MDVKLIAALLVIALLGAIAWNMYGMPDKRSTGERLGDAISALPSGVDAASRELKDKGPADKLGDAVKKVGEDIKNK